jgi:hypothetical protein
MGATVTDHQIHAKRIGLTSIPAASSVRGNGPEKAPESGSLPPGQALTGVFSV